MYSPAFAFCGEYRRHSIHLPAIHYRTIIRLKKRHLTALGCSAFRILSEGASECSTLCALQFQRKIEKDRAKYPTWQTSNFHVLLRRILSLHNPLNCLDSIAVSINTNPRSAIDKISSAFKMAIGDRTRQIFSFTSFLVGLLAMSALGQEKITFAVTYRDFLPADCMDSSKSPAAFADYNSSFGETSVTSLNPTNCANLPQNWLDALENRQISGHPDFETSFADAIEPFECVSEKFPVNSCIFAVNGVPDLSIGAPEFVDQSVVKRELVRASSGIPKPQYCSDDPEGRCGANSQVQPPGPCRRLSSGTAGQGTCFTTSRKRNFDSWYNDDRKYNKRVGQLLTLTKQQNGQFVFASDSDRENDEFGGLGPETQTDVAGFFDPLFRFKNEDTGFTQRAEDFDDPFLAKAWPQTIDSSSKKAFWITTEIHSTFQYRREANMLFEFSGDDDFWCFINGKLAIDIGGLHPQRSAQIDLNSQDDIRGFNYTELLGLKDGGIYTIDIFHAERHTSQSNFKITTTLFEKCNVGQSGTVVTNSNNPEDVLDKFTLSSQAQYDVQNRILTLLPEGEQFVSTFAFTTEQQNVGAGFITKFNVIVDGSPEGFAIVIQRFGVQNYPFSGGRHLNFKNVPNSFAIAFDLCSDRASGSCNVQTVSLHYPSQQNELNKNTLSTRVVHDTIFRPLNLAIDGVPEVVPIEVRYLETPDHLEVYIDDSLYLLKTDFNISEILGGQAAHIGLTATSGGPSRTAEVNVTEWKIILVEFEAKNTETVNKTNFTQQITAADGTPSQGVLVKTRDFCGNQLDAGGLDGLLTGLYVEVRNGSSGLFYNESLTPVTVPALATDNEDGSYTLSISTTVKAEFSFFLSFGENCDLEVFEDSVLFVGDPEVCYFASIANAVDVVAPEDIESKPFGFNSEADRTVIYIVGSGLGAIGLLSILAGMQFWRYRNRWERQKEFILAGERYNLEESKDLDLTDDLTRTGQQVLDTSAAILRERAQQSNDPHIKELLEEESTHRELKAQIYLEEQQRTRRAKVSRPRTRIRRKPVQKTEFGLERDDLL